MFNVSSKVYEGFDLILIVIIRKPHSNQDPDVECAIESWERNFLQNLP